MKKSLSAFLPETASTALLVDMHCYDSWPALAALEDIRYMYICGYVQYVFYVLRFTDYFSLYSLHGSPIS